jgi:hypothetical protein
LVAEHKRTPVEGRVVGPKALGPCCAGPEPWRRPSQAEAKAQAMPGPMPCRDPGDAEAEAKQPSGPVAFWFTAPRQNTGFPAPACRESLIPMAAFETETVLTVHHWNESLFTFTTTRGQSLRFDSGHFVMVGLMVEGKPLLRAYSIASPHWEEHLEFFSIKVPNGR